MDKMKKVLDEEIYKIPRHFTRVAIKKKLKKYGIKDKGAVEAFLDHVLSGKEGSFEWRDAGGASGNIIIEFTEKDGDEVLEALDEFLHEGLPELIKGSIEDNAKGVVKQFKKRWPEVKLNESYEARHFSDRIDLYWSKGLDPLRMMIFASREIGEAFAKTLSKSKAKNGGQMREALMILHARACQTTLEILTLIENGFADGAYARWRTLYEITVVAFFVSKFGDEVARRYLLHDAVSARDLLENEFKFSGEVYDPSLLEGEAKQIERDYQAVIGLYGNSFKGPYGWAAESLACKAPRFQDLEKAVDWGALPSEYKWSSFKVHAGSAGALRTLGSIRNEKVVHAGASNAGLQTPAIHTATSLLQITSLIFSNPNQLETAVQLSALMIMRDKVVKECRKVAKKIEKDELRINTGLVGIPQMAVLLEK